MCSNKIPCFSVYIDSVLFSPFERVYVKFSACSKYNAAGRCGARIECRPSFRRGLRTAVRPTVIEPLIAKVGLEHDVLRAPFRRLRVFIFRSGEDVRGGKRGVVSRKLQFARNSLLPPQIDLILATCRGCSIISFGVAGNLIVPSKVIFRARDHATDSSNLREMTAKYFR